MKRGKLHFIILLVVSTMLFAACKREDPSVITPSVERIDARFISDTISVVVKSNYPWEAIANQDWIHLVARQDPADTVLRIVLAPNTGSAPRQGSVLISSRETAVSIMVIQGYSGSSGFARAADSMALRAIYDQCGGKEWVFSFEHDTIAGWDLDKTFNTWTGVTTNVIQGTLRVTALNLSGIGVKGVLPQQMEFLTEIGMLTISDNMIEQSPFELLSYLPKLALLDVSYNAFKLDIPDNVRSLSNLMILKISGVNCGGAVDRNLEKLSNLQYLEMARCSIEGQFPEALSSLTKLVELNISNNEISGELPTWIGRLSNLTMLNISLCQISGVLPSQIGDMSRLEILKASSNRFEGAIPRSIGRLSNLRVVNLSDCRFTSMPDELYNCSKLQNIDLSFNNIEYQGLPLGLVGLVDLKQFMVSNNRFSGTIDPLIKVLPGWTRGWYPRSLICPQQTGWGFDNCK